MSEFSSTICERQREGEREQTKQFSRDCEQASVSGLQNPRIQTDEFDFLVVASGHFGTPSIPNIPGLDSSPRIVHSSNLQSPDDIRSLLGSSPKGKLVVIGGSMSGVEAASSLALHISFLNFRPDSAAQAGRDYEVWHVGSGPFWVLPTYLPHQYAGDSSERESTKSIPFVPLDLSLYDLGRRPQGMNEFVFGPVSPEQISKRNQFFRDMLGNNYGRFGGINITDGQGEEDERPPWVGIADYYTEYIRSGAIKTVRGRAYSVACPHPEKGTTINIQTPTGMTTLTDVAAIVAATGFKPSDSLSFLPQDILSTLEYSKDHFLPLILDSWSSAHSDIPNLGFVGFYRGAFWGPAELQAQNLAQTWAKIDLESADPVSLPAEEQLSRAAEREKVREFRDFKPAALRGQFPLGDYVGLMGSLAQRVNRARIPIEIGGGRGGDVQPAGPVVPARYPPDFMGRDTRLKYTSQEVDITMKALNGTISADPSQGCVGTTAAVFRALHGQWSFERVQTRVDGDGVVSGQTTFHPRYPSSSDYGAEYLCEEINDDSKTSYSVYRLCGTSRHPKQAGISVWSVEEISPNAAGKLVSELHVSPVGKVLDSGEILVQAQGADETQTHIYEFYFDRVAITRWSHRVCPREGDAVNRYTTQYSRPADA